MTIERSVALQIVLSCLREAIEQADGAAPAELTEDAVIVGKDAALDSVAVVSLIVDVEQKLEQDHGISLTLASDKAMSQRSSPFRTAGVLADHVCAVAAEGASE